MEQRSITPVAPIKVVEHQETSGQSQGHPLQWYGYTHTHTQINTVIYFLMFLILFFYY